MYIDQSCALINFLQTTLDPKPSCREVRTAHDQCIFVKQHCQDEDDGRISYLELYYCTIGSAKVGAWFIIIPWAAFLFLTVGITAGDFFAVNLSSIARTLRMSDTFAGVTLLALGNGGMLCLQSRIGLTNVDSPRRPRYLLDLGRDDIKQPRARHWRAHWRRELYHACHCRLAAVRQVFPSPREVSVARCTVPLHNGMVFVIASHHERASFLAGRRHDHSLHHIRRLRHGLPLVGVE